MGKLYRAISADGSAFAEVLDAKDIVSAWKFGWYSESVRVLY